MSIETAIVAKLESDATVAGLVDTRIYPLRVKQDADMPAITYMQKAEHGTCSLIF